MPSHGIIAGMYERRLQQSIQNLLNRQAVVGLLGPRQVGKTTLALRIAEKRPSIYLDMESISDLAKLTEPELYLQRVEDKLVVIDEIQRRPDLFQVLRGIIDKGRRQGNRTGRFLVLGSASLELLKQSSESLAGRIAYAELSGLLATEIEREGLERLWLRGGFPESFTASDDGASFEWREDFIRTYLERDIPQFGPRIPATTLHRFWTMLAHNQGTVINAARLASALGVSGQTVGRYLDLLVDLLLARRLQPWMDNTGKRLVKSPKVYVRDSGIVHRLLNIENLDALYGHPVAGGSWEGFIIETLIASAPRQTEAYYYRTSSGAEIDLLLRLPGGKVWAIEIKRSLNPKPEKGFHFACDDIQPDKRFIVYPGGERFPITKDLEAIGLIELSEMLMS